MTALEKYIRLEAEGLWRAAPGAEPRAVVVSFGNATLVMSAVLAAGDDAPLAHWSLAATRRVGEAEGAVLFAPDQGATETLALRDPEMIAAIEAVTRPPKRRRRWPVVPLTALLLIGGLLGAGWVWGPGLLRDHAFRQIPAPRAMLWGSAIAQRLPGAPCREPEALLIFQTLAAAVAPDRLGAFTLRPLAGAPVARLPGGHVLLDPSTLEESESPAAFAGWLALGAALQREDTALYRHIDQLSPRDTLLFLVTGEIREYALLEMTRSTAMDAAPLTPAHRAAAVARLTRAGLSPAPMQQAMGDPVTAGGTKAGPLTEAEWQTLRQLCAPA